MQLTLSAEDAEFRDEMREFFTTKIPQEIRDMVAAHRELDRDDVVTSMRILNEHGLAVPGWPVEWGGRDWSPLRRHIWHEEMQRACVPIPLAFNASMIGPVIAQFGSQEMKEKFLPPTANIDIWWSQGFSEPDAGSDLASVRTSAVRDGDEYVVNGQKMWTTGGHQADYVWLAVRTDPDAPKHKGISILIVDTRDPGYSWTPIITADGSHHVNATYYNDVRVPADMLVGEENQGWRLITTQLNHERVMLGPAGRLEGLRDRVAAWAETAGARREPDVAELLGKATAVFRVNELLNWQVARQAAAGEIAVADASATKVFASDQVQHLLADLISLVHRYADTSDPATRELVDYLDAQAKRNLVLTFGGGVQEVQRELIAMFGLGLPRVPR